MTEPENMDDSRAVRRAPRTVGRNIAFSNMVWIKIAAFLVMLSRVSPSYAEIVLTDDIEGGSLQSYAVNGNTVALVGETTWTEFPDRYRWVHFRASGVLGKRPTFRIGSESNQFFGDLTGHRFVYSTDGREWKFFDEGRVNGHQYVFSNRQPFTSDDILVAYSTPYPVSRTMRLVRELATGWFVSPTSSSDSDLIIDRISDLPLYGFKITNPLSGLPKKKIVAIAGNHSGEMGGNFALEGLLEFLSGHDPVVGGLRNAAEFYVYPQVDPLGRTEGFYRGNSQNPAVDHNRVWDVLTTQFDGGFSEIPVLATAMRQDTEADVDLAFDFHGFFDSGPSFLYSDTNGLAHPLVRELLKREPELELVEDNRLEPAGIFEFWAKTPEGLNADFSYTPEMSPNMLASDLIQIGRSFGQTLAAVIGEIGPLDSTEIDRMTQVLLDGTEDLTYDFDRNGIVDQSDRAFYVHRVWNRRYGDADLDGLFSSTDLIQVFQAAEYEDDIPLNSTWATGDWNGDFEFDSSDLVAAFQDVRVPDAVVVPEPASGLVFTLGLVAFLFCHRIRSGA